MQAADTSQDAGRDGPLKGLRVLDFSRVLSGPYASMVLADLGAEVIKIEPLGQGDETRGFPPFVGPLSHYFIALNRNKKSIAINLKTREGLAIAHRLAEKSDIVLENFRPGVMDRLGLGYEELSRTNPRLVYCSISGFGLHGPLRDRPAFDIVVQALSGVMSVNGQPGREPARLGLPMGDLAGSIFAVFGILAAINQRHSTGKGCEVEVAMLDSLMALLGYMSQIVFVSGKAPGPVGSRHPNLAPYGAYKARDGYVIVACLTERFWHNFARALGHEALIDDSRFSTYDARLANRDALEAIVAARMAEGSVEHWLARLEKFDVPHAPINDIKQALEQTHCGARDLVRAVTHPQVGTMRVVSSPLRFNRASSDPDLPPPLLGEHTVEVLTSTLGLAHEEIDKLVSCGAVNPSSRAAPGSDA